MPMPKISTIKSKIYSLLNKKKKQITDILDNMFDLSEGEPPVTSYDFSQLPPMNPGDIAYASTPPQFVGTMPIRQDIQVLAPDAITSNALRFPIAWTVIHGKPIKGFGWKPVIPPQERDIIYKLNDVLMYRTEDGNVVITTDKYRIVARLNDYGIFDVKTKNNREEFLIASSPQIEAIKMFFIPVVDEGEPNLNTAELINMRVENAMLL